MHALVYALKPHL